MSTTDLLEKSNLGIGFQGVTNSFGRATKNYDLPVEKSDVQWFSAQLNSSNYLKMEDVSDKLISSFVDSSEELKTLSANAWNDLLKVSKSLNPQDVIHSNRSLSSFYLQSLLTAKLVGKGVQAIEKLTSLQ